MKYFLCLILVGAAVSLAHGGADGSDKISNPADRNELLLIELNRQNMELKKQIVSMQQKLMECQSSQTEKSLKEWREKVLSKYKVQEGDELDNDWNIHRKSKPKASPAPAASARH